MTVRLYWRGTSNSNDVITCKFIRQSVEGRMTPKGYCSLRCEEDHNGCLPREGIYSIAWATNIQSCSLKWPWALMELINTLHRTPIIVELSVNYSRLEDLVGYNYVEVVYKLCAEIMSLTWNNDFLILSDRLGICIKYWVYALNNVLPVERMHQVEARIESSPLST